MDERNLGAAQIKSAREKANEIRAKIIKREEQKAKEAEAKAKESTF